MRGRELIALKLPQMVEAQQRRREEQTPPLSPTSMGHSSNQLSQSSTISDMSLNSPTTPSAGAWNHASRLPSSTSSLPASPLMRESFEGYGPSKRPLTDLKEETEDRDDDVEMVDGIEQKPLEREFSYNRRISDAEWTFDDPHDARFLEYDPADESDFSTAPKRQRSDASPFNGIAARIGAIKPSFSRKWKARKASPTIAMPGPSREPSLSRANSTRAPSFASASLEASKAHASPLPPTPTRSAPEESFEDAQNVFVDADLANSYIDEEDYQDQAKPTTPLLPPLMTAIPDHIKDIPYQSPLQSPTVADPEPTSAYNSPLATPQITCLPSPPLSARPSIASFRGRQRSGSQRTGLGITQQQQQPQTPLVPSAEIPPNPLEPVSTPDHWSNLLGHANFTISPVPYTPPAPITASSCNRLRSDWDAARFAYAKHLSRTGEHYGPTSKTYALTQEKWTEIDNIWMRNIDAAVAAAIPSSPIFSPALSALEEQVTRVEARPHPPLVKMPSLSLSDGKFPGLGDEGIVGPMEVVASPLQKRLEALQRGQREREQQQEGWLLGKRKRKWRGGGVLKWVQGLGVYAGMGGGK